MRRGKQTVKVARLNLRTLSGKSREVARVVWNIVIAYAPLVGCSHFVKQAFWNQLDTFLIGIPTRNLNGQIGENKMAFERWPSAGNRNEDGEKLLLRA